MYQDHIKRVKLTTLRAIPIETVDVSREIVEATTGEDPRASVEVDVNEAVKDRRCHDVAGVARAGVAVLRAVVFRAQAASTPTGTESADATSIHA